MLLTLVFNKFLPLNADSVAAIIQSSDWFPFATDAHRSSLQFTRLISPKIIWWEIYFICTSHHTGYN